MGTFRNIYRKTYCVDDYGKSQINHAYRTYICSNKNENQWFSLEAPKQLAKLREGWFNIVSKNGLCVSSRLNNSNLQQEKCGDLDTLLWTIEKTTNGRILRSKTGRQMDASGLSHALVQRKCELYVPKVFEEQLPLKF